MGGPTSRSAGLGGGHYRRQDVSLCDCQLPGGPAALADTWPACREGTYSCFSRRASRDAAPWEGMLHAVTGRRGRSTVCWLRVLGLHVTHILRRKTLDSFCGLARHTGAIAWFGDSLVRGFDYYRCGGFYECSLVAHWVSTALYHMAVVSQKGRAHFDEYEASISRRPFENVMPVARAHCVAHAYWATQVSPA